MPKGVEYEDSGILSGECSEVKALATHSGKNPLENHDIPPYWYSGSTKPGWTPQCLDSASKMALSSLHAKGTSRMFSGFMSRWITCQWNLVRLRRVILASWRNCADTHVLRYTMYESSGRQNYLLYPHSTWPKWVWSPIRYVQKSSKLGYQQVSSPLRVVNVWHRIRTSHVHSPLL